MKSATAPPAVRLAGFALTLAAFSSVATGQTAVDVAADPELTTAQERANRNFLTNELSGYATPADVDLLQIGDGNTASLQLLNQGTSNSRATIAQVGVGGAPVSRNVIEVVLDGGGNGLSILQQGDRNVYRATVEADDATLSILQRGDFNEVSQAESVMLPGAGLEVFQTGDGNVLDADGYRGLSSRTITVTQEGGATARISDFVGQ